MKPSLLPARNVRAGSSAQAESEKGLTLFSCPRCSTKRQDHREFLEDVHPGKIGWGVRAASKLPYSISATLNPFIAVTPWVFWGGFEMFWLYVAHSALFDTRLLLKSSLKSDNKKYVPGSARETSATPDVKQKWNLRNENQKKVEKAFAKVGPTIVTIDGLTVLEAGEKLYQRAVADPETWYGNCGDQSLIALYFCYKCGVAPEYLYQFTYVRGNFSHSLVVLTDPKNRDDPQPVCCDPWMDIACYHDEWKNKKADEVLHEWTRQGKRLKSPKVRRGVLGSWVATDWVEPSNAAILGFAADQAAYVVNANDRPKVVDKRS